MSDYGLINVDDIKVVTGLVEFGRYDEILEQAKRLNDELVNVEVTEDSIKENKKLVAAVRKESDNLNDIRKTIKKQLLEPYELFEKQVKEITETVSYGEQIIRDQIREYDEHLRSEKEEQLLKIIERRLRHYPLVQELGLDLSAFIQRSHLNKTVSIDKAEGEIVQDLEAKEKDLGLLSSMEHGSEMIVEYINSFNITDAIQTVQKRHARIAEVAVAPSVAEKAVTNKAVSDTKQYKIIVSTADDYLKLTQLAEENGIEYKGEF